MVVADHFTRLLDEMDPHGYDMVVPEIPPGPFPTRPLLDFEAGYIQRSITHLPRQGTTAPWLMPMDYRTDAKTLRTGPLHDPHLRFAPSHPG